MTMHQDDSEFVAPQAEPVSAQPDALADAPPLPTPPRAGGDYVFDPIAGTYTPMAKE